MGGNWITIWCFWSLLIPIRRRWDPDRAHLETCDVWDAKINHKQRGKRGLLDYTEMFNMSTAWKRIWRIANTINNALKCEKQTLEYKKWERLLLKHCAVRILGSHYSLAQTNNIKLHKDACCYAFEYYIKTQQKRGWCIQNYNSSNYEKLCGKQLSNSCSTQKSFGLFLIAFFHWAVKSYSTAGFGMGTLT